MVPPAPPLNKMSLLANKRKDLLMKPYAQMERSEQSTLLAQLKEEYEKVKAMGLKLDMSRGKQIGRAHV